MRSWKILIAAIAVSLSGTWAHADDTALRAELDAAKDTLNAAFEAHDQAKIVSMMTTDHLIPRVLDIDSFDLSFRRVWRGAIGDVVLVP